MNGTRKIPSSESKFREEMDDPLSFKTFTSKKRDGRYVLKRTFAI